MTRDEMLFLGCWDAGEYKLQVFLNPARPGNRTFPSAHIS